MRKIIFAPYFGKLPVWTQAWLDSCAWNPTYNWVVLTDDDVSTLALPSNVVAIKTDLASVENIFSSNLGFKVELNSPYKLCDCKPLYWMLLKHYNLQADFWGWCDLDVIFGNLSKFLPESLYEEHDRVLCLGHLSLIRNCSLANYAFMLDGADMNWRSVYQSPTNVGFDEHHGLTSIWKRNGLLQYDNEKIVADIDPQFKILRLTIPWENYAEQMFYVTKGAVYRAGLNFFGKLIVDEYAYIHFQKRSMDFACVDKSAKNFMISERLITSVNEVPHSIKIYLQGNYAKHSLSARERIRLMRTYARYCKRVIFRES